LSAPIVIVGGGPAGTAAGITLAQAGRDVVLLERERGPAHKVCGDFLSGEAVTILDELGVDLATLDAQPLCSVRVSRKESVRGTPLPFRARSLTRRTLDEALLERAEAAGVRVQRGVSCERIDGVPGAWRVLCQGLRELAACDVFVATGKHDLRGQSRSGGVQNNLIGFKMYWRLGAAQRRALGDAVELHLFHGGYAGLQRVENGEANLCCAVERTSLHARGPERWEELLARMMDGSELLRERLADAEPTLTQPLAIAPIPYGMVRASSGDGLWRVGDQAAVIPSFTGDGVSMALWSGQAAARMMLAGAAPDAFQQHMAAAVRGQVGLATCLSRWMVTPTGQALTGPLLGVWPGAMETIARHTRLREI
jgi:flavin-dependent dehydrogenase